MARFATKGFLFTLVIVLAAIISSTNGNWYGKRGDKVNDALYTLLERGVPNMIDRQLDAQMTLHSIAKLLNDYQLRQLDQVGDKGVPEKR